MRTYACVHGVHVCYADDACDARVDRKQGVRRVVIVVVVVVVVVTQCLGILG